MNSAWISSHSLLFRRPLLEAALTGAICGAVGVHGLLRRLASFTHGVAHAAFPGVVLAVRANLLVSEAPGRHAGQMGDLAADTAVEHSRDGRYRTVLSADWEIWGPMGGYVAACALRAAGAASEQPRPAAMSCHYLGVARFGPVEVHVEPRKQGRTVSSHRVEISQDGRPILDAMVWSVGHVEGLEHDETQPPDVPGPDQLRDIKDLLPRDASATFPFASRTLTPRLRHLVRLGGSPDAYHLLRDARPGQCIAAGSRSSTSREDVGR